MALASTTKGFFPRKNLDGGLDTASILEYIIGNSNTITIGDAIKLSSGFANVVSAGDKVMGICVGIVDKNGLPIGDPAATKNGTLTGDDTYAAASNNQTVDMCKVQIIVSKNVVFYNKGVTDLTTAAVGLLVDTAANGDQITGTGSTSAGAFQIVSIDPDGDADAKKALVRIAESQLDPYAQV